MTSEPPEVQAPVEGLTDARAVALERVLTRSRESAVTRSSWRLSVASAEGGGTIVLLEGADAEGVLRGEGVFLGWTAERLRAAYDALRPRSPEPLDETTQLG